MTDDREIFGGTPGAPQGVGSPFEYSVEQWSKLSALIGDKWPDAKAHLERLGQKCLTSQAQNELGTPAYRKKLLRVSAAVAELLDALSDPNLLGVDPAFWSDLLDLGSRAGYASSKAEGWRPNPKNSNVAWTEYLFELCMFWSNDLDRPVKQRRKADGSSSAYGPCVDFIVAAASAVRKKLDSSERAFTAEMALHAIRHFQERRKWEVPASMRGRDRALEKAASPEEFSEIEDAWLRANRDWARENTEK